MVAHEAERHRQHPGLHADLVAVPAHHDLLARRAERFGVAEQRQGEDPPPAEDPGHERVAVTARRGARPRRAAAGHGPGSAITTAGAAAMKATSPKARM